MYDESSLDLELSIEGLQIYLFHYEDEPLLQVVFPLYIKEPKGAYMSLGLGTK